MFVSYEITLFEIIIILYFTALRGRLRTGEG